MLENFDINEIDKPILDEYLNMLEGLKIYVDEKINEMGENSNE